MDTLAHFLWTFAIYWKHPRRWIAGLIGVLPDLLSFGLLFIIGIVSGVTHTNGPPSIESIPGWVFTAYNITHSLVVFTLVAVVLWFLAREWFWLIGGWLLHIIIDIPTHTTRFFPTPIFWPISSFVIDGTSWGVWWFMLLNYSAIIGVYTWLVLKVPGPKIEEKNKRCE